MDNLVHGDVFHVPLSTIYTGLRRVLLTMNENIFYLASFVPRMNYFVRKSSMKPVYIVKGRMRGPTVSEKARANENEEDQSHQGTRESRGINGV